MSMLRLLHPVRAGSSSNHKSAGKDSAPTLTLHVPAYGVLYLTRPRAGNPGGADGDEEGATSLGEYNNLAGELEIHVPAGSGRRRCRSIKVGITTISKLAMGPSRGWEEDIIFERESEQRAGTDEGIILEEGRTKFEFTFALPASLAAHDWHPEALIRHELHAEIEGLPAPPTGSFNFLSNLRKPSPSPTPSHSRRGSPSSSRHASPSRVRMSDAHSHYHSHFHGDIQQFSPPGSRSSSPPPGEMSFGQRMMSMQEPASISLIRQVQNPTQLPQIPTYEQSEADAAGHTYPHPAIPSLGASTENIDGEWLVGNFKVTRSIKLCYNCHPTGGINALDERTSGNIAGVGAYNIHFRAPVWTISSILSAHIVFTQIPPTTTIFDVRILLVQNIDLRSPRDAGPDSDAKAVHFSRPFTVIKHGKRPNPENKRPGKDAPALWRGTEAGGQDSGDITLDLKGRLPNDKHARPSTVPEVHTPLRVSHQLVVDVYFAIWSKDSHGRDLVKPGPGEQTRMRITRSIMLPACPIIPQTFSLPAYPTHPSQHYTSPNAPCPLCHTSLDNKLCTACPFDRPAHPRHDHPPKLVGNEDGICPLCSASLLPAGEVGWKNCACALSVEDFERFGMGGGDIQVDGWRDEESAVERNWKDSDEDRGRDRTRRTQ